MAKKKSCKIVWWNIGVSPPTNKKNIKVKRDLSDVIHVLKKMHEQGAKIFGLCEISDKDVTNFEFQDFLKRNSLTCVPFFKEEKRIIWDIALIIDEKIFKIYDFCYFEGTINTKQKKVAVKIDGKLYGNDFRLYLSHFPTLLYKRQSDREKMYTELTTRIKMEADSIPYNIAMGDYNIELCSSNIIEKIARSREYSKSSSDLYSPFIRHIGEKYEVSNSKEISGTFYLKSEKRWAFVDYLLITEFFLYKDSKLCIDDFDSGIWDDFFNEKEVKLDHLPIYTTIFTGG